MIQLVFLFWVCNAQVPDLIVTAWQERHILLLGRAKKTEFLPKSIADAGRVSLKLKPRLLDINYYRKADLSRNQRMYGEASTKLKPTLVVLHFTVVNDLEAVMRIFKRPSRIGVGNQKPVISLVSVHYVVDKDGTVYSLVPEDKRTTGSYGVDHRALAIEMIAADEKDLLSRPKQLLAAFTLTKGLVKKYKLHPWDVVSHQEVAMGKFFLSEYTDLADTEYPYFYPEPSFRYDPGTTTMAWFREFLLRDLDLWKMHPGKRSFD